MLLLLFVCFFLKNILSISLWFKLIGIRFVNLIFILNIMYTNNINGSITGIYNTQNAAIKIITIINKYSSYIITLCCAYINLMNLFRKRIIFPHNLVNLFKKKIISIDILCTNIINISFISLMYTIIMNKPLCHFRNPSYSLYILNDNFTNKKIRMCTLFKPNNNIILKYIKI